MRVKFLVFLMLCAPIFFWTSCKKEDENLETSIPPVVDAAYLSGGATTSFVSGASAYSQPLANLPAEGVSLHFQTQSIFFQEYSAESGLGPQMITNSCVSCHVQNGRGQYALSGEIGHLMRISLPGSNDKNGPLDVPNFGTQLQTQGIGSNPPEGQMAIDWESIVVNFPDGYQVTLQQPYYSVSDAYSDLPDFFLKGGRVAPPVYGVGLLDAISDETLLLLADEFDTNGDGISGKVNWVWNIELHQHTVGKFGWKSGNPNVLQQSADAFHQDMGMTTFDFFPEENCYLQTNCEGSPTKGGDVSTEMLSQVTYYLQTIAPPAPRNLEDPEVQLGKQKFSAIGCDKCHLPEITTDSHPITELSNQVIRPYSDLLLHELGAGLGDGRPEYDANANEWRTPPLWGIGLTKIVYPDAGFLHDGRAQTLEEAILWHEGEGFQSRQAYIQLNATERAALIKFLEAL